MFSSRNIHFTILGLILGASAGYIFAFYQVESSMARQTPPASSGVPQNHPDVTPEEILRMFEIARERNPNDPELLARYGGFLFSLGRFQEAAESLQKSLTVRPNHVSTMEDLFNVQLEGLKDVKAAGETIRKMSEMDPAYAALPTLRQRLEERSKAAR